MAQEPKLTQDDILLADFLALNTPEGYRAELIEGEIVVTPPPDGDHEDYLDTVTWQVSHKAATRMSHSGNKGLIVPSAGSPSANHVIPDATFAPRELRLFRGAPSWMECDGIAMVVEVTSSRAEADRVGKRKGYARAGIPLYLLIDRDESMVTLFSQPEGRDYTDAHSTAFGKPLPLPAPFDFELDTADFL
ncbi:Uma2 family endonuclease [Streptomyces sp. LX-29]|uniref:Uma2 family endonuclease n=1 Tax=Streptomyces sp. LX-29 TaxID=2900152 RepID=UPI00240D7980|nr:Uma2 family endonuclease [Streptomyces sp. LX-29]WFB08639.1 Uma2 family endonuclease [Streptomyces sp. LX-29]